MQIDTKMFKNKKKPTPKEPAPKQYATKAVIAKRVALVLEMKTMGYQDHEILSFVNTGGKSGRDETLMWDIKFSTLRYYIKKAYQGQGDMIEKNLEKIFESSVRRWTLLIRKCHREGDNTNLIKATKELDDLMGLRKTNINISGLLNTNDVTGLSNEDLDAAIVKAEEALKQTYETD